MKILLFIGTSRDSSPPYPSRLGVRVSKACSHCYRTGYPEHSLEVVDPLDYPLGAVFKPHFAYRRDEAPAALDELADKIGAADGYMMVSPEYNHSMSPALAHLLNHFGSSLFAYKPSAIVTYSAGQWGGMRAAVAMRTFLSELGCLPVSAMIHIPKAQQVFADNGDVRAGVDQQHWFDYFGRTFAQLVWWAEATSLQRERADPGELIKHFTRDPEQRNAP